MSQALASGDPVFACGDFNTDIEEFQLLSLAQGAGLYEANVFLGGRDGSSSYNRTCGFRGLRVYSPWIADDGSFLEEGSYCYQDSWEKIDHFFAAGRVKISEFSINKEGPWVDQDGKPFKYKVWNGLGYSDHLPLLCRLEY